MANVLRHLAIHVLATRTVGRDIVHLVSVVMPWESRALPIVVPAQPAAMANVATPTAIRVLPIRSAAITMGIQDTIAIRGAPAEHAPLPVQTAQCSLRCVAQEDVDASLCPGRLRPPQAVSPADPAALTPGAVGEELPVVVRDRPQKLGDGRLLFEECQAYSFHGRTDFTG